MSSHPYSYLEIGEKFRKWYRQGYMRDTLHAITREHGQPSHFTYSLKGLVGSDDKDREIIDKSLISVRFMKMSNEIWAANFVAPRSDGSLWGMIYVNTILYDEVVTSREEAEKRKFILAHEWLEVLYVLCNHSHIKNGRAVAKRAEMYALMGAAELGLPWQDSEEHLALMVPALRDLLVSAETIKRLCGQSMYVDSHDDLVLKFLKKLREEGRGPALILLQRLAEEISIKIHVARLLVLSRLEEMLKIPRLTETGF